jgi:hypothetical protein
VFFVSLFFQKETFHGVLVRISEYSFTVRFVQDVFEPIVVNGDTASVGIEERTQSLYSKNQYSRGITFGRK